jgi:hypothetical protein
LGVEIAGAHDKARPGVARRITDAPRPEGRDTMGFELLEKPPAGCGLAH